MIVYCEVTKSGFRYITDFRLSKFDVYTVTQLMEKLFVVEMLRFENREAHSYVLGVYTTHAGAKFAGDAEEEYRGGKYSAEISEFVLNAPVPHKWLE